MVIKNHEYRIKKMNMIEVLALQSQITFKDITSTEALYNAILERIEVNIGEKWLPVKKGNDYFPAGIEDDIETLQALIANFLEYLKSVFQKSDESNNTQSSMTSETQANF